MMTKSARHVLGAIATSMLLINIGCARSSPTAPASPGAAALASSDGASLTSSAYRVTLLSDLTASPSSLTVASGYKVLFVNQSGLDVAIHSYNCSQFTYMDLPPGYSKNTLPFSPSGKVCDYFAYDDQYRKIFAGRISVQ